MASLGHKSLVCEVRVVSALTSGFSEGYVETYSCARTRAWCLLSPGHLFASLSIFPFIPHTPAEEGTEAFGCGGGLPLLPHRGR